MIIFEKNEFLYLLTLYDICYTMFDGMKKRSLTYVSGIALLALAACIAWFKLSDSPKQSQQQKSVSISVATPHRERTKLQPQKEGPIKVSFKLKPSFVDPEALKKG